MRWCGLEGIAAEHHTLLVALRSDQKVSSLNVQVQLGAASRQDPLAGWPLPVKIRRLSNRTYPKIHPMFGGRARTPQWGTTEYGSRFGSSRRPLNESARYAARASPVMMSQPRAPHSYSPAPQHAGRTRPATEKDVSMICRGVRAGTVLRKQTILKADHFPSGQNPDLAERINGAPNFRQVNALPIFGVGQPTVDAMLDVVSRVGTPKMIWCNLREEPVVYINGKPFCLKDRSMPFNNVENTGIEAADVERMEETLRREIIHEASCNGGEILLHDETAPAEAGVAAWGEVVAYWETITPDSVMTPAQVYGRLKQQGWVIRLLHLGLSCCACQIQRRLSQSSNH